MGSFTSYIFGVHSSFPILGDANFTLDLSPVPLMNAGLNIGVIASTATAFRQPNNPQAVKTAQLIAHFDTGANITSIDIELARKLNLIPTGQSPSHTAAGMIEATNFIIDLSFPGATLRPFINLQISSCHLSRPSVPNPVQFGLLLGRDVMSRWNIVWNGPPSTVFIYD
jgi:hypothetical protein